MLMTARLDGGMVYVDSRILTKVQATAVAAVYGVQWSSGSFGRVGVSASEEEGSGAGAAASLGPAGGNLGCVVLRRLGAMCSRRSRPGGRRRTGNAQNRDGNETRGIEMEGDGGYDADRAKGRIKQGRVVLGWAVPFEVPQSVGATELKSI